MNAQPIYAIFLALLVFSVLMITLGVTQSNQLGKKSTFSNKFLPCKGQNLMFSREDIITNKTIAPPIPSSLIQMPKVQKFPLKIEGHRGAGLLEPENTIKSYKRAIELELDAIELDVWLTKDGVPVISHNNISRYGDQDFQGLKYQAQEAGRYLLSLAEVLDISKGKISLNIELKDPQEVVVRRVLDLLEERDMLGQVMISSFHHYQKEILSKEVSKRNLTTKVSFGFLMNIYNVRFPNYVEDTQPGDAIVVDFRYLKNERKKCLEEIKKARKHGVKVSFWFYAGFKMESMYYDDLVEVGVDAIVTNYPLEVMKHFEAKKKTLSKGGKKKSKINKRS